MGASMANKELKYFIAQLGLLDFKRNSMLEVSKYRKIYRRNISGYYSVTVSIYYTFDKYKDFKCIEIVDGMPRWYRYKDINKALDKLIAILGDT